MKKTVAFTRDSVNIFFHLLTGCNLRCSHCYINPAQHGRDMVSRDTAEKWLFIILPRNRPANLILLGGEPTLHPDLAGIIKSARKMGYASVTIDTNGYLFHDILDKVTSEEVDYISFSLDGATAGTNDRIRGKGCFATCLAGVRATVKKGVHTSMIYTVSSKNIHELSMMPELMAKLGIERFFIQVIGIRGKSAQAENAGLQVDPERWNALVPAVAKRAAKMGIHVTYPKVFLDPDENFECAGKVADNYFIFPNGRVYRCPLCEDYPLHSLRFTDEGLEAMPKINERDLFNLNIAEGCVMNRLVQPGNIPYHEDGTPANRIACCLLKEEIRPEK